ncbi:GGDEF domain-containing protein [Desulfovibrio ferrophilus]|uniref:diguanylate cyclase n=1 Tax=Desulfovibrio ferrophilus TaxID=241368 RepID=A0A2Z6AWA7_9BACT|nr:GGDEF domain-containing protein [Desulfovibrio ferrophilus]BBD07534.1 diguanylate cyclase GGDEF domain-containing protein [Desulfovibrio ferrophilus]
MAIKEKQSKARSLRISLTKAGLVTVIFMLLVLGGVGWISHNTLFSIVRSAHESRNVLIPDILARQRSAMNIERLGRFGEIIFYSQDPSIRRAKRLTARILMQDLAFEPESATHAKAQKVFRGISTIARLRDRQDALRTKAAELALGIHKMETSAGLVVTGRLAESDRLVMAGLLSDLGVMARTLDALLESNPSVFEARRNELSEHYSSAVRQLDALSGVEETLPLRGALTAAYDNSVKAVELQRDVLAMDSDALTLWGDISQQLDELADSIATDAGLRAVTMAEAIKGQADKVGLVSYAMTGLLCSLLLLVVWVFQRHVLGPILSVTRALEAVHGGKRNLIGGPRAFFVELDAIGKAVERYAGVLRELRDSNAKLHDLSLLDGLTNLANRRHFDEELRREISRATRNGRPLSLLMLDVDRFKEFNDKHGHMAGDACLAMVAKVLQGAVRRPGEVAARYGGEEFAVILPEVDRDEAAEIAEKILKEVAALRIPCVDGINVSITISIGVAVLNGEWSGSMPSLLDAADSALYCAKAAGRNRVIIHGVTED